jgi:transmembrane sensor
MSGRPDGRDYSTRSQQASSWRIRIEATPDIAESSEFQEWFSDSTNQDAYARKCATWDTFEDHLAAPQIIAIRRDALERARRASQHRFVPTRRHIGAIAAGLLFTIGTGVATWHYLETPAEYSTNTGERRIVVLDDGSRISLDSDTAVRVKYGKAARQLVLERGRARFDVVHNVERPFTVTAGDETVVAVGTSFDVERLNDRVLVTLIEGRIVVKQTADKTATEAVRVAAARSKPMMLNAGQELIAIADVKPTVIAANMPVATAWESGRLIFNDEPLVEAVERVNRYSDKALIVDPAVAQLRISGVFNAGDINAFVDGVTSFFPVQSSVNDANQTVLQKRS